MNYIQTMNHDLYGLKKLLLVSKFPNYTSVAVHSLFRDSCLMLYEINRVLRKEGLLKEDIPEYTYIEYIRHKVKSSQGSDNRKIFNNILKTHIKLFGYDIDNLGFYFDEETLVGSTLFVTYVYNDTPFFQSIGTGEVIKNFSIQIGSTISQMLNYINHPIYLPSKPLLEQNQQEYKLKDIWHKRFFIDDITYNVFVMRLLIIQNEVSTCLWLEKHLDLKSSEFNLDKYILLRLSSIRLHETMKNLLDLKQRLPQHFSSLGLTDLDSIISTYTKTHSEECKILRDMLHYSNEKINFYEYIESKMVIDNFYIDNLLKSIIRYYFSNIRKIISRALNISSINSMSDWEKIRRRITTKVFVRK